MRILRTLVLTIAVAAAVLPFVWLLSTSLKGAEELFAYPPSVFPSVIVWENYPALWNAVPMATYLMNSFLVTGFSVAGTVFLCSLSGFALARYRFRHQQVILALIIAAMMVPKEVIILPLFTIVLKLGMADSLTGVVLPFLVDATGVFMMRQAFLSIPAEIEEAGVMDGASPFLLWWRVMMPMTRPMMATLAIFTFIASWGDFLWPLVVLRSPEQFTLQVGLSYLMGTFVDNFRYVAAGAVIAVIPVVIIFILMQRSFERGLFAGSGK